MFIIGIVILSLFASVVILGVLTNLANAQVENARRELKVSVFDGVGISRRKLIGLLFKRRMIDYGLLPLAVCAWLYSASAHLLVPEESKIALGFGFFGLGHIAILSASSILVSKPSENF